MLTLLVLMVVMLSFLFTLYKIFKVRDKKQIWISSGILFSGIILSWYLSNLRLEPLLH